jgi:hypothetical protein
VIRDATGEVSRTSVAPAMGVNNFDITDVAITGDACIILCPTTFDGVTGEDFASPPYGDSYWTTICECTTAFVDNNLMIWADTGTATPVESVTWGTVRALFR